MTTKTTANPDDRPVLHITPVEGATAPLSLTVGPPPEYLLTFSGDEGMILCIRHDFTIEVIPPGTMDDATRAFWRGIEFYGRSLVQRAEDAESRVRQLEAECGGAGGDAGARRR